jgi:sugar lactone lactonase YvrE
MAEAEQITEPVAYHGEGPVWDESWGGLRFVDMLAGDVLILDEATGTVARHHVGDIAAAIRPRAAGGMVIGIQRGFALVDPDGTEHSLGDLWPAGPTRMNDGACDPHGRFYCGSMSKTPGDAALYRLDTDRTVSVVQRDVTTSNGLAWSPDGGCAYYNDTPTQHIDVFDYSFESGLTGRRTFAVIDEADGKPDGLTVDADGYVWVALFDGGAVRRYAPDGLLDAVVTLPVTKTTAVALGGADLRDLYITTSRENLPADVQPEAGALFRLRVDVPGTPLHSYAG